MNQPEDNLPTYAKRDWSQHPRALHPPYRATVLRAPSHPRLSLLHSSSELSGPVFGEGDLGPHDHDLYLNAQKDGEPIGERIIVYGTVTEQSGRPVPATLIEIWQANAGGRYLHPGDNYEAPLDPNFTGCGRCLTDGDGRYEFRTVRPGPYPWPNGPNDWRPAHIHLSLFGHSILSRLVTQIYFEGDPLIPLCPIANSLADEKAVARLTARLDMERSVPFDYLAYRFDIVLRGPEQTYFESS